VNEATSLPEFFYIKGSSKYYGIRLYDPVFQSHFPEKEFTVPCNLYQTEADEYKELLTSNFFSFESLFLDMQFFSEELIVWMEDVDAVVQ